MWAWLRNRRKWRHCPHITIVGIYGDLINHFGGYRLVCKDCDRLLDGPVEIANWRYSD